MKLLSLLVFLFASKATAARIAFSVDELAKDTVLPVFDEVKMVKNRLITKSRKIEVAPFFGMSLGETFYNQYLLGAHLNYNFNEDHGLGFQYIKWGTGLSSYAQQLNDGGFNLNFNKTPGPQSLMLLNYIFTGYYGKLSLTKKSILQNVFYGSLGGGMVSFPGKSFPAFSFGMGQKYFFTNYFNVVFDLKLISHSGPNPLSVDHQTLSGEVNAANFDTQAQIRTLLTVAMGWFF